jgi:hypothetical protein
MFNFKKMILPVFLASASIVCSATSAGYIKTLRFASGGNGTNYAVISTSLPQNVSGTQNYVGGISGGIPYTVLVLPSDPTLCALAGAGLERARANTATNFYFNSTDVRTGTNPALADVPGIPSSDSFWINLVSSWYLGQE